METESPEVFVQPADDVEDECLVGDRLAEVMEILRHALEAAAVIDDWQVALGEGAELLVGVESKGGAVPKELGPGFFFPTGLPKPAPTGSGLPDRFDRLPVEIRQIQI